jgi:hypothetical protein
VSEPSEPNSFADVEQLKRALVQFLADRADWKSLSKELTSLAKSPAAPDDEATRQAWLILADYLKHSAPTDTGVPPEVRRFLQSDEAARAAEAAFGEMLSQRQKWLNFANELKRPRSKGD